MSLASIIGQETAITTLRRAMERDAVPQAYLFVGPESVGKTTTALEFIKTLSCKTPKDNPADSCDGCANCNRVMAGQHPDIIRVAPDGEFTRIWQLWSRPGHPPGVLETLPFQPVASPKRVFLFEKAETLNDESANSMLKALEEPPSYVQMILCAPALSSVLPTILSRCQVVRFRPVALDTIAQALQTRLNLPEAEARSLAAYSQGAPGRAFRMAEMPEVKEQREALLELGNRIANSPGIASFRLAEDLRNLAKPPKAKKGEEAEGEAERTARGDINRAVDILTAWYADLLAVSLSGPDARVIHADRRPQLAAAAARYRREQIEENISTLFTFRSHLARNANAQIATEVLMLRLVPKKAPTGKGG